MTRLWMSIGLFLAIIGLIGSVLPILPGTSLSLAGMVIIEFLTPVDFSTTMWRVVLLLVAVALASDYVLPLLGAKIGGGTPLGIRGSLVGLVVGVFVLPWGLIIGPLLGAWIGEWVAHRDMQKARQAAWGSFLGSIASTVIKLIAAGVIIYAILQAWW